MGAGFIFDLKESRVGPKKRQSWVHWETISGSKASEWDVFEKLLIAFVPRSILTQGGRVCLGQIQTVTTKTWDNILWKYQNSFF